MNHKSKSKSRDKKKDKKQKKNKEIKKNKDHKKSRSRSHKKTKDKNRKSRSRSKSIKHKKEIKKEKAPSQPKEQKIEITEPKVDQSIAETQGYKETVLQMEVVEEKIALEPIVKNEIQEPEKNDEDEIMKLFGFSEFGSSKGKDHSESAVESVYKGGVVKRKYRQYMNRKGGFNKPLDKMA